MSPGLSITIFLTMIAVVYIGIAAVAYFIFEVIDNVAGIIPNHDINLTAALFWPVALPIYLFIGLIIGTHSLFRKVFSGIEHAAEKTAKRLQ